jgi:predicted phosphodiesterase
MNRKDYDIIVIESDHHVPYHDVRTMKTFNKFLKDIKPDTLVINGDLLDCYDLSRFDKDYDKENGLQYELDEGYKILKEKRKILPKAKIVMTESNHMEARLDKQKRSNAKPFATLRILNIPDMLRLNELSIESIDFFRFKKFMIFHGDVVRQDSAYSAKANLLKKGKSSFTSHTHRLGSYYKTDEGGTHVGAESGCMCQLKPEYVKGIPNWQQGFIVIYRHKKTDWYQHFVVPIIDGKFIFNNKVYN